MDVFEGREREVIKVSLVEYYRLLRKSKNKKCPPLDVIMKKRFQKQKDSPELVASTSDF